MTSTSDEERLMKDFLFEVTISLQKTDEFRTRWVVAVHDKFNRIGLTKVKDVMINIIDVNRLLQKDGYSMMHVTTLRTMARIGTNFLIRYYDHEGKPTVRYNDDDHYSERGVADLKGMLGHPNSRDNGFPE